MREATFYYEKQRALQMKKSFRKISRLHSRVSDAGYEINHLEWKTGLNG